MNLAESFISAIQSVRANKMRSFLTMLGIIIGISSVITIVSIGQGGKQAITGEFRNIGTNVINIRVNARNTAVQPRDYFTLKDAALIQEKIPYVTGVLPFTNDFGKLKSEKKSKEAELNAVTELYPKLMNIKMLKGRFLNERDVQNKRNVIVIDDLTAVKLYGTTDIIGKKVLVSLGGINNYALIIGICKNPSGNLASLFGENFPGAGFIPVTVADRMLIRSDIGHMSVMLSDMSYSNEIATRIVHLLEKIHRNEGKYTAEEGFKQLDMLNNVLNIFTMVIGAIAGISLLVGGIGVMNIMLVSVTERTREIGIRKALGAKKKDIMLQFLTESLIICLIGGTIGMILGIVSSLLVGKVIKIDAPVSPLIILVSVAFSSAIGVFFGLYPANKAAGLDPIEALRYE